MKVNKKQIITIGGLPGSGKSTTAKGIASQFSFKHFSSGDLFREVSKQQGQNVLESNLAAEKEDGIPAIDELVDQKLRDLGENEDRLVIDSRLAWHWMPYSFKVFLNLDHLVAAERILKNMTPERIEAEHIPANAQEYEASLSHRLASESRRYSKIYKIDPYNTANYDLVIDTAIYNPEEVISLISDGYSKWISSN